MAVKCNAIAFMLLRPGRTTVISNAYLGTPYHLTGILNSRCTVKRLTHWIDPEERSYHNRFE